MQAEPHFNGPDYQPALDFGRLTGQIRRIYAVMKDGRWRTLSEIAQATGDHEASISAQLRHLRKDRFGGYQVGKRRRGNEKSGLFEYQVGPAGPVPAPRHRHCSCVKDLRARLQAVERAEGW